jgi:hypothetical protein
MVRIKVNGHEFEALTVKDSFNRRALQIKNSIITSLRSLGLTADDVEIELEPNAKKRAQASVSWYLDKQHLHYSHSSRSTYVENLSVVSTVISLEITALLEERITLDAFMDEFSEDIDVVEKRKDARAVLGLGHDVNDMKVIDKAYKGLAKKHHPDTDTGDTERFKEINHAHKILKRELR